jgi:hypothetical protein
MSTFPFTLYTLLLTYPYLAPFTYENPPLLHEDVLANMLDIPS